MLTVIWHGVRDSFLMAWEVWWALVLGFAISAFVQARVPRERVARALGGDGPKVVAVATGLGAASSSCSYAAIAIARSLFARGATAVASLAFAIASTNLVWELGLVLLVLLGWQFAVAEYLGAIVMIVLIAATLRTLISPALERQARNQAQQAAAGHDHGGHAGHGGHANHGLSGPGQPGDGRLGGLLPVARAFHSDVATLWKEITIGFLLAGFIAQLPNHFFSSLFITHAPAPLGPIENVIVGPIVAVLSFVCSIGNVPLAAVLWSGGISFGGVLSFLFADLIVLPIIAIYRKYYGTSYALRITLLMFVTMALAALAVEGIFSAIGAIPSGPRPTRHDVFGSVALNYKLALNLVALVTFAVLMWLSVTEGRPPRLPATDAGADTVGTSRRSVQQSSTA
ncbi:MAG: permease [Solirubrobacterales bacterium]|nr:permease [Solirubrobacterales bacterium]